MHSIHLRHHAKTGLLCLSFLCSALGLVWNGVFVFVFFEMGFGLHGHNVGTSEVSSLVLTVQLTTINIQLHLRFLSTTFAKLYVKMQLKFRTHPPTPTESLLFKSWQESLPFKTCQIPAPREILYNGDDLWAGPDLKESASFAVLLFSWEVNSWGHSHS